MLKNLLKDSRNLKIIADRIINELKIVELFSGLGEVYFVGSYFLEVMFRPDIDLIVISKKPDKRKATELTKQIINKECFQTVGFADWFCYPKQGIPKGFYWELISNKNKVSWKFDVWYLTKAEDYSIQPNKEFKSLLEANPSMREIILRLKKQLFNGVKYKWGITSFDIYEAVLKKGVKTVEELRRFQCSV